MPARISTSQGTTNRRLSSPLVSPLPSSNPSSHRDRNARHSRHTSWSTGNDLASSAAGAAGGGATATVTGDSADYPSASGSSQRRRRESSLSQTGTYKQGPYNNSDKAMALRNTSMDWKGHHARSRSQSHQAPTTALQDNQDLSLISPHPSASASASPLHPNAPPFPPGPSSSFYASGPSAPPPVSSSSRPGPVTWMSLPRKKQLAILGLCRVFDFLQIASLQAYMFYQLKSFDQDLSDSDVSTQAGILQGAFTAAQFATAIPWGRVADAEWGGRKFVLLVGLLGTAVSCLGVAFSTSFAQAVFWRSFGGAINGTVGIIRTAIAENVKEKKYHSRAFLILPIGFNIASLFGPGELLSSISSHLCVANVFSHGWYAV